MNTIGRTINSALQLSKIGGGVGINLSNLRESVSMPSGSRVFEKWTDVTPLANLDDETAAIGDNDDPKLTLIKFAIKRYACNYYLFSNPCR